MSDKRSVSTDALATLGTIIQDGGRDAIHLAVEPVIAGEVLYPGQHIGIVNGKAVTDAPKHLGIVDPFLGGQIVKPGQKFWLIVYPRQISSLRHVWSHPDFPEADVIDPAKVQAVTDALLGKRQKSIEWVTDFAEGVSLSYDEMMKAGEQYIINGDYITGGSNLEGEHVPDDFWDHYEIITGTKVSENDRGSFFNCSC